jgi:hypothetical protein
LAVSDFDLRTVNRAEGIGSKTAWLATRAARRVTGWRPNAVLLDNSSLQDFGELATGRQEGIPVATSESVSHALPFATNENYHTTLDMLFVGCRVCVRRKPQTCGEVVRVIPMTRRVIVRFDPPYPTRRGTLRSFRPERLAISIATGSGQFGPELDPMANRQRKQYRQRSY